MMLQRDIGYGRSISNPKTNAAVRLAAVSVSGTTVSTRLPVTHRFWRSIRRMEGSYGEAVSARRCVARRRFPMDAFSWLPSRTSSLSSRPMMAGGCGTTTAIPETASLLGGASPAVEGEVVVAAYSSGEIYALTVETGRPLWSDNLASTRNVDAVSTLADIRGWPVIDRGRVYAASHSGRMAAIDLRTGDRLWEQEFGSTQSLWVAGDYVYVLSTDNELICLTRNEGKVRWVRLLPNYRNEKKRKDPMTWAGPVLGGDRLIVLSSDGDAISVSPYTGEPLGREEMSAGGYFAPGDRRQFPLCADRRRQAVGLSLIGSPAPDTTMSFAVAILGRPNVGKSTLFNRLVGRRLALVDNTPGLTRDRREGEGRIADLGFRVIDTAGLEEAAPASLEGRMRVHTERALAACRRSPPRHRRTRGGHRSRPSFCRTGCGAAANRLCSSLTRPRVAQPFPASARPTGSGLATRCRSRPSTARVWPSFTSGCGHLPLTRAAGCRPVAHERPLQLGIVGRPNVGKSTLANRLIGEDRLFTGPEAGITRDAIAVDWIWRDRPIRLVDTAGLRRRPRVEGKLEELSVGDALRAIRFAETVILVTRRAAAVRAPGPDDRPACRRRGPRAGAGGEQVGRGRRRQAAATALARPGSMSLPQLQGVALVPVSGLTGLRSRRDDDGGLQPPARFGTGGSRPPISIAGSPRSSSATRRRSWPAAGCACAI